MYLYVYMYVHFLNLTYVYIYIPWSVIVFIQKSFWSTHLDVFSQKEMYYIMYYQPQIQNLPGSPEGSEKN